MSDPSPSSEEPRLTACRKCGNLRPAGKKCPPCHAAYQREWNKRNPESRRKTGREYKQRVRMKARKLRRQRRQTRRIGNANRKANARDWILEARTALQKFLNCWKGNQQEGYKLPATSKDELHEVRAVAEMLVRRRIKDTKYKELRSK